MRSVRFVYCLIWENNDRMRIFVGDGLAVGGENIVEAWLDIDNGLVRHPSQELGIIAAGDQYIRIL